MTDVPPSRRFRLYVAGESPNSVLAGATLRSLCREHFGDDCTIELVDVLIEPHRALEDGILVTPTLVRLAPPPVVHSVGNLSRREAALSVLGISGLVVAAEA